MYVDNFKEEKLVVGCGRWFNILESFYSKGKLDFVPSVLPPLGKNQGQWRDSRGWQVLINIRNDFMFYFSL